MITTQGELLAKQALAGNDASAGWVRRANAWAEMKTRERAGGGDVVMHKGMGQQELALETFAINERKWMLSTPDSSTNLDIVPMRETGWDMNNKTTIGADGSLRTKSVRAESLNASKDLCIGRSCLNEGSVQKMGQVPEPLVANNLRANVINLGDKWRFSGVGDAHGNDDWLRMFDKDGKGYRGGIAMNMLWVGNHTSLKGGTSEHNPGGGWTHFPWAGDNKNYIRGDTEIRGNTNNIGDMNVGRNMNVQGKMFFGDPAMGLGPNATNSSDPYYIEKVVTSGNNSSLRVTINDDWNESMEIWGNSCGSAGGCAGPGAMQHKFQANGDAEHKGTIKANKLCIGNTCLDEAAISRLGTTGSVAAAVPAPIGGPRTEIVNRRPIWGVGSLYTNKVWNFNSSANPQQMLQGLVYNPFGYGVPPPKPGATRKWRMYAVYSDGITGGTGPIVRLSVLNSSWQEQNLFVDFSFPLTWGGVSLESRDAYSNTLDSPSQTMHSVLYTFIPANAQGNKVVNWHYIELQALDVYP